MRVFSKCEKALWKERLFILAFSLVLYFLKGLDLYDAIGLVFVAMLFINTISEIFSYVFVTLIYQPVKITDVRELKHSETLYQYIVTINGKEIYSNVYNLPLEKVVITAYRYRTQTILKVEKKRR